MVKQFSEKKRGGDGYINGGFFVLKRKALDFIKNDKTIWEQDPMKKLSEKNQLAAYIHNGFWQSMDTYRDLLLLDEICKKQKFPWEI